MKDAMLTWTDAARAALSALAAPPSSEALVAGGKAFFARIPIEWQPNDAEFREAMLEALEALRTFPKAAP